MVECKKVLHTVFSYETPKIVAIRSLTVGIISRVIQLAIFSYIIGYVIVYKKGYQDFSIVQSSVTTKVKGIAYTNFSDEEFNPFVKDKDLYRRIWDVADYVVPPSESNSFFVTTNIVITPNQTLSTCPEDRDIHGAKCDPNNNTCVEGKSLPTGNGVMTGNCTESSHGKFSCQIHAWCPVEFDKLPLVNNTALLAASKNFTVLIKNFVEFPKFKNSRRRNIKDTSDKGYLQSCHYDAVEHPDCPIFVLGDIVRSAGADYNDLAKKGGVIAIVINWDCNFDWDKKYCFPTYSFSRLDDEHAQLAPGWNFRYAQYYSDNSRTLYKVYGIKFAIIVQGQAGKFAIVPLLLNVGAGLGLLAVQVVICDIVVLYVVKKRDYYKSKKFEDVVVNEGDDFAVANSESLKSGSLHEESPQVLNDINMDAVSSNSVPDNKGLPYLSSPGDYDEDRYQRLVD